MMTRAGRVAGDITPSLVAARASRCTAGLETLKRRSEYLRLHGGRKAGTTGFLLETKPRAALAGNAGPLGLPATPKPRHDGPRFGFTVTKKIGGAVARNRIRRRLKEAVRAVASAHARAGFDYVVVARKPAFDMPYATLVADMRMALDQVHGPAGHGKPRGRQDGPPREPGRR